MARVLVIPVEGAIREVELPLGDRSQLKELQELVAGRIEAVPLPEFIDPAGRMTAYVNEEGKNIDLPINKRATDFLVPSAGLAWGDYIAGPLVVCGFDPARWINMDVPAEAVERAALIALEAPGPRVT